MLLFAAPTIGTVLIAITYDIIDGFFVSNYIGKTAFAAVNIIYPFQLMLSVIGYMFGTGGSALVASEMGRDQQDRADQIFTMLIKAALLFGILRAFRRQVVMQGVVQNRCAAQYVKWLHQSLGAIK